ncbi:MAG: SDR family oxidoreductase [Candidatus Auribacterota bacterium]|jgi:NAD(P)-dependent dehydrogenase (short-subunit alcohol dehydrogenase family)|nr:SDR family oxidoreductase [Candidatus Auribacterota bacterium]
MNDYLENMFNLKNKTVIITGAAGQLGGAYVRAFLQAGARVAAFDIDFDKPNANLDDIDEKYLLLIESDITKKESLEEGLACVISHFGNPSVLIANAALDTPPDASGAGTGPLETYPEELFDTTMEVNVKGTFLTCQVIGGHMASHAGGSIILVSSIYGILSPDQRIYEYKSPPFYKPVSYAVSKSAVYNLTRYLATYWANKNVRVNTVTLGGVYNNQDPEFLRNYAQKVPLGRMARHNEYNGAMLFLASDASSYMTGSNMVIDGGFSCW